ncbi:MAG: biotin/lipoyl-containing protein, partial [Streptosporangiaceae bacterium]
MPDVLMPRLSDTMEEGTLSQWVKHEGDQVRKGDVLAVIETDKAAMEMEAYDEGVLARVLVEEGSSVPIGTPIAVIGQAGAGVPASPPTAPPPPAGMQSPGQQPAAAAVPPGAARSPAQRVWTSPLARNLAREHGIDLTALSGTGPGGRIVRADIEDAIHRLGAAQPARQPAATAPAGPSEPAPATPAVPPASAAPAAKAAAPAPAPAP